VKKAATLFLISLFLLGGLAVLVPGGAHGAAAETANTPQWVLVQNLTFDNVNQINAIDVSGDSENVSVSISGGLLNISLKNALKATTTISFNGFAPGPSKWVMKYKAHNMSSQSMTVDSVQMWGMYEVKLINSDGTSTLIPCHSADTMQQNTIIMNATKHIWIYEDGVEKGNGTHYTQYYYDPTARLLSLFDSAPVITLSTTTPADAYLTLDYIAQYKQMSDYQLSYDNIFFNRWDDGSSCFFENGMSLFAQKGYFGTMSVITGVDNWTNISKLEKIGWDLSDHTRDHLTLTTLSLTNAENEIAWGKEDLIANISYTPSVWTPPTGATNNTLNQYAYNSLGLSQIYVLRYRDYSNDEMGDWAIWNKWQERAGGGLGHEVREDVIHGETYITAENLSKILSYVSNQKLFVLGYTHIRDIAENRAYGTITRTVNTDTEKRFSVSGPGQWAEVAVKGNYSGNVWQVQDEHGHTLNHFYKDGYTYILVKLDPTKGDYSGTISITPTPDNSTSGATSGGGAGFSQFNTGIPLWVVGLGALGIVGIAAVALRRRR